MRSGMGGGSDMGTRVVRVAVNGYGVIGKRMADAVSLQDDMALAGVADVVTDYRIRTAVARGCQLFASTSDAWEAMRQAGLPVKGRLEELLSQTDVVVDCTPRRWPPRTGSSTRRTT
jgi:glyceraldehyde-3-phosphate dehydrogenase (NAD(P)+) (phosphorylating)